ncbi:LuxR C-terminal-related transcriptional regulator [Sutcliffiella sp. FSL R7-0096]|uniref:helix-turn-helix transcriptional regulator n=1 Tax=Sutcliffiella sp. FSL R7-0096 TaxID=2921670 RepID=UPI00315A9C3A
MNKKEIENILKDYHWMMNSIKILKSSMNDAGEGLTAQYGDEAGMPKAQGITGDPIYREVVRREKRYSVIEKYKAKISVIQDRLHLIIDDRELEVLHWLLEGKSYRWIALHMGLSHSHIRRIRESIVNRLCDTNVPNVPNDTKLMKQKSAC